MLSVLTLFKYFFISLSHTIPKQPDREYCARSLSHGGDGGGGAEKEQTIKVTVSLHRKKYARCVCKSEKVQMENAEET